jgi:hypothetical protein
MYSKTSMMSRSTCAARTRAVTKKKSSSSDIFQNVDDELIHLRR